MSDRIVFDNKGKFFVIDAQRFYTGKIKVEGGVAYVHTPFSSKAKSFRLTPAAMGKIIASALINGTTRVQFDRVVLSVNYLTQMLGFVGKHGWFSDLLSHTSDHRFDGNQPTPGLSFGEAHQLLKEASSLDQYARQARVANQVDEAKTAEQQAAEHRSTAKRLLTQQ